MPNSAPDVRQLALHAIGWIGRASDIILPPRCVQCGVQVAAHGLLCGTCWQSLSFITAPMCQSCGLPFDVEVPAEPICAGCITRPPAFDRAMSVLRYDDGARRLILGLKYGDRTDRAAVFGRLMAQAAAPLLSSDDLLIPVPLHPRRLRRRRFNQSALIVQAMARFAPGRPALNALIRTKATPSQEGLTARQRWRNTAGAFAVRASWRQRLRGQTVVLIDDVFTTGATLDACSKALSRAGVKQVLAVTLARVVRPNIPLS